MTAPFRVLRSFSAVVGRRVDLFLVGMVVALGLAVVLPLAGRPADVMNTVVTGAVALLFFLYGVRLSPQAAWQGVRHWRLHLTVLAATFALFPLLGWVVRPLVSGAVGPELATGLVFLCLLPSTVQSSIAFTAIARGNVTGAICAASFSSLLGVVATPLLAAVFLGSRVDFSPDVLLRVVIQLLVPFLLGQLGRRWLYPTVSAHPRLTTVVDRGSVLLIIYVAFAEAVAAGLWHQLSGPALIIVIIVDLVLLAVALAATGLGGRWLGFDRPDRMVIIFCGSKKSMAVGIPMAGLIFSGQPLGLLVLPLMIFHQLQLIVCAVLARRLGRADADRSISHTAAGRSSPPE